MAGQREFDLVVYGATGFTGRLVAEYLVGRSDAPRWAMAGRSADKLAEVRDLIGAPADTPLVVADAADPASLDAMVARTDAVVTTVGPYQLYGNELVAACVRAGTHYADLCGEPGWMRHKIDEHHDAARASGARITFSCGFDSIPFDLGVWLLQDEVIKATGAPSRRIRGRVRGMQGGFSGGTAASLKATMAAAAKDPGLVRLLVSPFALTPGFDGPAQPRGDAPLFEEDLGSWSAPFIMATINTKNVHRTNFLAGHRFGPDFVYDEMMLTGAGEAGEGMARAIAGADLLGGEGGPKPGEGPSKEERENGFYDVLFVADLPDGNTMRFAVKGDRDPGYGSTSRMLAETGILLPRIEAEGGVWTPGALMAGPLSDALSARAGISFAREG